MTKLELLARLEPILDKFQTDRSFGNVTLKITNGLVATIETTTTFKDVDLNRKPEYRTGGNRG
jgi:hypothetical protein